LRFAAILVGMTWTAREAMPEDAEEIARINVAGWRAHYRGLMPQEVLDRLDEAAIAGTYRELLTAPPVAGRALFVAVGGGRIGAFCGVCPVRVPQRDAHPHLRTAELAAIYADPAAVGSGAGHAVHEAGMARLADAGFEHAVLWAFDGNSTAHHFYLRHGWSPDGATDTYRTHGHAVPMSRYCRPLT
jgi:GNAT superfamily N-acetyltransferase